MYSLLLGRVHRLVHFQNNVHIGRYTTKRPPMNELKGKSEQENVFLTHFYCQSFQAFYRRLCQKIMEPSTNPNSECVLLPYPSHNVQTIHIIGTKFHNLTMQKWRIWSCQTEHHKKMTQSNRPCAPPSPKHEKAREAGKKRGTKLAAMWQQAGRENHRRHKTEARRVTQSNESSPP